MTELPLLRVKIDGSLAIMCSEVVLWRCHRRLIAEHLVRIYENIHKMSNNTSLAKNLDDSNNNKKKIEGRTIGLELGIQSYQFLTGNYIGLTIPQQEIF